MHEKMDYLLQSAELTIKEFDIHIRNEMQTLNRTLPCYVMSYLKVGEAKLRIGDDVYTLTPGTVVIIPPHTMHDHYKDTDEETVFLWCHYTYQLGTVIDVMKFFNFPLIFKLRNHKVFESAFLTFKNLTASEDFLINTILKKAKSYEILYMLLKNIIKSNEEVYGQSEVFICILNQIVKNPYGELSLQELSKKFHLHPTYISNRFKQLFGKSPMQMQRELKIDEAKKLLRSSELTVTEISNAIGFTAVPGFTRLFKNYVGISPSQYRKMGTKRNDHLSKIYR